MAFRDNPGHQPRGTAGKRVRVILRGGCGSGLPERYRPPESWPADGRQGCRWTLNDDPFDILQFEVE